MNQKIKKAIYPFYHFVNVLATPLKISLYLNNRRTAFGIGYKEYKWKLLKNILSDAAFLNSFKNRELASQYGIGLDERMVEYPWIFTHLSTATSRCLDAGSTLNFGPILNHPLIQNKNLTIYTFYPEVPSFPSSRVEYVYGDLRQMPFANESFEEVVCHSTIEHVDMDNSVYGYDIAHNQEITKKSYDYLKVISELHRVLCPSGVLLLTFPFGKFENHGFFQQFDSEMLQKIRETLTLFGAVQTDFMRYTAQGWIFCQESDCQDVVSHNPHTGRGKGTDQAAHCRSVCLLHFRKS